MRADTMSGASSCNADDDGDKGDEFSLFDRNANINSATPMANNNTPPPATAAPIAHAGNEIAVGPGVTTSTN
jgi:hypothetical protein